MKIGQWAGTRRDLFSPYICDHLSKLHSNVNRHAREHTHAALVKAFGTDYSDRLVLEDVVGSGSAAQVYRGTLDGNLVAVKVLHPGIVRAIERDLFLMEQVSSLIDSLPFEIIKCLGLPRAVENFASILRHQVDLRNECSNLKTFIENFGLPRGHKVDTNSVNIAFPIPLVDWSTPEVLVEEYAEGQSISVYLSDHSEAGLVTRRLLARPLLQAYLKMVFIDNFVHSDLHPGNVLVKVCDDSSSHDIVFLDAGIVTSLSAQDQKNLKDLFTAVVLNRGEEAGRLMVERAKHERCSGIDGGIEAFSAGIGELVSEFHDSRKSGLTLGAVHIGSLLKRVLDLCRIHGVEIDPSMANVVVSTLVLEGLGRSLEPNLNLIEFAIPLLIGKISY